MYPISLQTERRHSAPHLKVQGAFSSEAVTNPSAYNWSEPHTETDTKDNQTTEIRYSAPRWERPPGRIRLSDPKKHSNFQMVSDF